MDLLLDTHVLLWWLADDPQLTKSARQAIGDPERRVLVSAASAWEISIKRALGKLDAPEDLSGALAASDLEPLPITVDHAQLAGALTRHHDDPFDRMLVAQATIEYLAIVTGDARIGAYDVPMISA